MVHQKYLLLVEVHFVFINFVWSSNHHFLKEVLRKADEAKPCVLSTTELGFENTAGCLKLQLSDTGHLL